MKEIRTNNFKKATSSNKTLFKLSQSMFDNSGNQNQVPIEIDDIEIGNGIFAMIQGTAWVEPNISEPSDGYTPQQTTGGNYVSTGDCRVSFFDATGEPLMPDGSPNPQQEDFDLDQLKREGRLDSENILKLESLIEHQAGTKGNEQMPEVNDGQNGDDQYDAWVEGRL